MTSITSLNVRLGMDASNFSQGVDLARSEVNRVTSIMKQSIPATEKYAADLALIDKTFSEAGKQSKQYANAVEFLRKKHGMVTPEVKKFHQQLSAIPGPAGLAAGRVENLGRQMSSMATAVGPAGLAVAGVGIAFAGAGALALKFSNQMADARTEIDAQAKAAAKLGMTYNELSGLRFAAGEISGVDIGTVEASMRQLQIRAAKAIEGDQKIAKAFAKVGIDAGKAMEGGPLEALKRIAGGFDGLGTHAEKLLVANDLFGKQGVEIIGMLTAGRDTLSESIEFQQKWNNLSDAQVLAVEAANDAWARMSVVGEGFKNSLAAETTPLVTIMAEDVLVMMGGFEQMTSLSKGFAESLSRGKGDMKDYLEVFTLFSDLPKKTWAFDFGGAADVLKNAFSFDQGEKELERLIEKRDELQVKAAEAESKREAQRAARLAGEIADTEQLGAAFDAQVRTIEQQIIALNEGEAAARRITLAAQGFLPEQIKQIEAQHELLDSLKKEHDRRKEVTAEAKRTADEQERQAKAAEDAFNRDISTALANARKHFEEQRKRDDQMRAEISKGAPSLEVGSAEAAKFMADQINAQIGAAAVPAKPTPGEAELLAQAKEELKAIREQIVEQKKTNELSRQLARTIEANAVRRAR